jgi:hypothetical protein
MIPLALDQGWYDKYALSNVVLKRLRKISSVTDIGGCFLKNHILSNVDGEISSTFKPAANEDKI